jgi:hypothetical protein
VTRMPRQARMKAGKNTRRKSKHRMICSVPALFTTTRNIPNPLTMMTTQPRVLYSCRRTWMNTIRMWRTSLTTSLRQILTSLLTIRYQLFTPQIMQSHRPDGSVVSGGKRTPIPSSGKNEIHLSPAAMMATASMPNVAATERA